MRVLSNSTMVHRLRHGVPLNQMQRAIELKSAVAYAVVLITFVYCFGLIQWTGLVVSLPVGGLILALTLICSAWMLRRVGHPRIATGMEVIGLGSAYAILALTVVSAEAVISLPFADDTLSNADRALGFDWLFWAHNLERHPAIISFLRFTYGSLPWQQGPILIALLATGRESRVWVYFTALVLSLAVTIFAFPLLPAVDSFARYGVNAQSFPNLGASPLNTGRLIAELKSGQFHAIAPSQFGGLVSFPSFHAAAATLLVWAGWSLKFLRWPILALNLCMVVATVFIGEHYLVDVFAGITLSTLTIVLASVLLRNSNGHETAAATHV